MTNTPDTTVVYYTANHISDFFMANTQKQLKEAAQGFPIVSVSHKPMDLGTNIVVDLPRSQVNIYRQALIGAKAATTKYIACCEDDVLYPSEHFYYTPPPGVFAYNIAQWGVYTWVDPPEFGWKGRRNLFSLICERELFIEAMEERFAKWPDDSKINNDHFAEPGKYESHLRVTPRQTMTYFTKTPLIVFSHETALSWNGLGSRKRRGNMLAYEIPYWGTAKKIRGLYA